MGVVQSRQGAGTFITDGPPALASEPLGLLAALHGLNRDGLFEARLVLEVGSSALAAERASENLAAMSEEVDRHVRLVAPLTFLRHDVRFHRAIAAASGNPVLGVLIDMLGSMFYERRRRDHPAGDEPARDRRGAPDNLSGHPRAQTRRCRRGDAGSLA